MLITPRTFFTMRPIVSFETIAHFVGLSSATIGRSTVRQEWLQYLPAATALC
jgi:hypothetical protein